MDSLKAIYSRRSIRRYKNKKVPASLIKKLINAGRSAPSAYNDQPWVFITITNQEAKDKITAHKSQRSQFIRGAPLLIACCFDETKSHTKAHNLENVAVAAENILLAAHSLGLGACYIGGFDPDYPELEQAINDSIKLPKHIHVVCLITIGYPDELPSKKILRPISEVWKREFYT